jgi:hypothetical protein
MGPLNYRWLDGALAPLIGGLSIRKTPVEAKPRPR